MKNLWPKILAVISALAALYCLFALVMLLPYSRFAGFKSNMLSSVAGFAVSTVIFIACLIAWRKSSRGPRGAGLR